ncbi:magnesium/cobalt transporter CorA [Oceanispirochaeta crateris]|uniref:magnesium/cobalt transporter CorA n=1 Tax=Oceanispirochaeta crateris TaxID=2518645 RepID=UPI00143DD188|nr:magnesium/cobalt transporter CorA [Oceanispirochaeta crateris]
MARFYKKRTETLRKHPGEMVYIGNNLKNESKIDKITYTPEKMTGRIHSLVDETTNFPETEEISWINIEGVSDVKSMKILKNRFNLNSLIIADIMNTGTRPKYQSLENNLFFSLKMLRYDQEKERILSEQLSIIVFKNTLVTFQEVPGDVFDPIRENLMMKDSKIRSEKIGYLIHSILDCLVDNYISILQLLAERIEDMEELLLDHPDETVMEKLISSKKDLLYLVKSIRPAREAFKQLINEKPTEIRNYMHYFNDLFSNITHVYETVELYKELTTEQMNTYNSYMNNRLNDIMRFLTVFSVIFLPLTLVAGIYGTNFEFIPELHLRFGYLYFWIIMLTLAGLMIYIFKKKKWM